MFIMPLTCPFERQVITVLRYQHMRQQARPRHAALDGTARRRRLHDAVVIGARRAALLRNIEANKHAEIAGVRCPDSAMP
jgi:hypothetical protein